MKHKTIKFGILLGSISILYFLVTNLLGISGDEAVGWLGYLVYLIVIYLGVKANLGTLTTFWAKFKFGVIISILGSLVSSLFMYLYLTYVDDLMIQTVLDKQEAILRAEGDSYAEKMEILKSSVTPRFYLIFGSIAGTLIGSILSVVSALIPPMSNQS